MSWLQKTPLVSLLFAVAIAAVPTLLVEDTPGDLARFENAREDARAYFVRNPQLEVDTVGALILDPTWLEEARAAVARAEAESVSDIRLPPRLLARSQAHLDERIADAHAARMAADPAWRLGVLDAQSPPRNYVAHAFVHEGLAAVILCVAILLFVGAPLERAWGSPVFAVFVLSAIPIVAQAYRVLDASSGVPWSGSAGLSGALIGAYFIRGLGGYFRVPGWLVLPAWIGVEAFVVRTSTLDDPTSVPWATFCAAVGFGAATASMLRLLNVEAHRSREASNRRDRGPNPVVVRAARMRSDGDPYQAFDLIQAAWRDDPTDPDVREAFYSIAVEVDQPEVAADAILPTLRTLLRTGEFARAVDYWFPLAAKRCEVALEPTGFVRLGEALLDASHPDEALFTLRSAIDAGVSSAGAARIVNIARDLDPELTRTAANIALADPSIEGNLRDQLERIVSAAAEGAAPTPSPEPPPESRSQLDRRVHAEHQTVETTAFPLDLDTDVSLDAPIVSATADGEAEDHEAALAEQALDAGALSEESLAAETSSIDVPASTLADSGPTDSGDVLSHWDDRIGLEGDAITDVSDALETAQDDEALLEVDDLETPGSGFDFGLRSADSDLFDPLEDETDTDLTPLIDSTDELTSPLAGADEEDTSTAVFDQPTEFAPIANVADEADADGAKTAFFDATAAAPVAPLASPTTRGGEPRTEFAFASSSSGATTAEMPLRAVKAVEAVPVGAGEDWIEVDADGRGKSKLPISRIDAIAIGAVEDLGPRPVLVIDLVLNWAVDAREPIKSIRLRSDRFDPLVFAPGAGSPLDALTRWVGSIEAQSGASCLPTRDLLAGRFDRFADLVSYEREVLMAATSD